jgi:hypothetical protein
MRSDWMPIVEWFLTGLAMATFLWPGLSLAGTFHQSIKERTGSPMEQTTLATSVKTLPMDAAVPVKTETATFALG